MSDFQQGPGWWQASDGRWYAPEQHPDHIARLPPPPVGVDGLAAPPAEGSGPVPQPAGGSRSRRGLAAVAGAGLLIVVVGAVVAALLLGRGDESADTAGGRRDLQPTDPAATETAGPTPAELRLSLADAGLDCGELGPYVAEPGEINIGFEPREAVTCTAASGSTVELVFMDSAQELATLLAVAQGFACGFDAVDQTIVYGETWYAEVFTTDGSVDRELTTVAADALGVDEQSFDCS